MVAEEENYKALEERGVKYAIRIPSNDSLERDIADLLTRPVGRPSHKPAVRYNVFPCPDDTPLPFRRGARVARDRKVAPTEAVGCILEARQEAKMEIVGKMNAALGLPEAEHWRRRRET